MSFVEFVALSQIPLALQTNAAELSAFSANPDSNPQQQVRSVPLQFIPKTSKGNYLFLGQSFREQDSQILKQTNGILPLRKRSARVLEPQDTLAFQNQDFLFCEDACETSVRKKIMQNCPLSPFIYKVTLRARSLFLAQCNLGILDDPHVKFRLDTRTVWSQKQQYEFKKENQMMVESYHVNSEKGNWVRWISGSEMQLFVDPKSFFSMRFSEQDIHSEVMAYDQGPLATLAKLSFFLEVLFFKVKLDLTSSVGFFEQQIQIPLFLTVPVNGDLFNPNSGFYFGFTSPLVKSLEEIQTSLPLLKQSVGSGFLKFDSGRFVLLKKGETCVKVILQPPSSLDKTLPLPYLVSASQLSELGFRDLKTQFGVYFPLSNFKKGEYRVNVDFWAGGSELECSELATSDQSASLEVREILHNGIMDKSK